MALTEININRANIAITQQRTGLEIRELVDGEIRVDVERFGLSSNNVSYAATGDMLGYWAHFSNQEDWGVVPVWGFAIVVESNTPDIAEGERIFGYMPMASQAIFRPTNISSLCFTDAVEARAGLHPWYTRLYRCPNDPAFIEDHMEIQQSLWALLMTGWMMAEELKGKVDCVYLSSASSKTAISLAWALKQSNTNTVGITSGANHSFVQSLNLYSEIINYDDITTSDQASHTAYVDLAGNAQVTSDIHVALGDKLVDSVLIGGTHRAPSAESLPMPGPAPRFFFIPDVAEEAATRDGFEHYHQNFAKNWQAFAKWSADWIEITHGVGADAVEEGYHACMNGDVSPNSILSFTW